MLAGHCPVKTYDKCVDCKHLCCRHFRAKQPAPGLDTVVDGDTNDRSSSIDRLLNDKRLVVARVTITALVLTTSIDEKTHGQGSTDVVWSDNIHGQAVLRDNVAQSPVITTVADAFGRVLGSILGSAPGSVQGLRDSEAQVVHWRLGKGHTEEEVLVVLRVVHSIVGPIEDSDRGSVAIVIAVLCKGGIDDW